MSSGRVQLASVGIQDAYLTGNPDFTFFLSIFKRHTRFSLQAHEIPFDSENLNFNVTMNATISKFGDLMRNVYLKVKLPCPNEIQSHRSQCGIYRFYRSCDY